MNAAEQRVDQPRALADRVPVEPERHQDRGNADQCDRRRPGLPPPQTLRFALGLRRPGCFHDGRRQGVCRTTPLERARQTLIVIMGILAVTCLVISIALNFTVSFKEE